MNLTPLALAAAYAYLNRSDKEKGDKEAPAATPTIAPAAAPVAQTTNAADMLSANDALNAGMNDYDTTGNIGKPMPMVKPPNKKPAVSSASKPLAVKPTTTAKAPAMSGEATQEGNDYLNEELSKSNKKFTKPGAFDYDPTGTLQYKLANSEVRKKMLTQAGMDPSLANETTSKKSEYVRNASGKIVGSRVVENKKGGSIKAYAKGGTVSASKRGDGIAQRGHTKGRVI